MQTLEICSKSEADSAPPTSMRALLHRRYGAPSSALVLGEHPVPTPSGDQLLVRVHAAGATIGDHHLITGLPYAVRVSPYGGLPRPRNPVAGTLFAGTVVKCGAHVSDLAPGAAVFGEALAGAYAEYVLVPRERVAHMPRNFSFEQAAVLPWGLTALQALRDGAELRPGQRVLIHGASGGVGSWAVQIAKSLGAFVTAVCSAQNLDYVRALGADAALDYARDDFARGGMRYDVMLDLVGDRPLSVCRAVLTGSGTYLACSGRGGDWFGPLFRMAHVALRAPFTHQRLKIVMAVPRSTDLTHLKELAESGAIKPVVAHVHTLEDAASALAQVGLGHTRGQRVISVMADG